MRRLFYVVPGLSILALGVYVTAWAQQPSADDLGKLVAQDAKAIQDILGKPTFEKKAKAKVRAGAIMIAQYAQSGISKDNPNSAKLATLRDKAIELAKAADADNLDGAKKLAAELAGDIKAAAGAKLDPVALDKVGGFDLVMKMFSIERLGGFGLEKTLDELANLPPGDVDAGEAAKIQLYAHKLAQIAVLAHSHPPAQDEDKKTKKSWLAFSKDMLTASHELAAAAKTRKGAAIIKAADNVTGSCSQCHDIFR